MFIQSIEQARRFFYETWQKCQKNFNQLSDLEKICCFWVYKHPNIVSLLKDAKTEHALHEGDYLSHPFIHLSLHMALTEQIGLNTPIGIREVYLKLLQIHDEHNAHHLMMQALWQAFNEAQTKGIALHHTQYLQDLKSLLA